MSAEDPTEDVRRALVEAINSRPTARPDIEVVFGQVWDTEELQRDFEVTGFLAPFVGVVRKADGVAGSLMFQHQPRYYFGFKED